MKYRRDKESWKNWTPTYTDMNVDTSYASQKINSKWIIELNIKYKTISIPEDNTGEI